MTVSWVVFGFGLVITGIVALGVINAREVAQRTFGRAQAVAQQQREWAAMRDRITRERLEARGRVA